MARRKKGNDLAVSLFPFLSILACVIGVLTLMITALALGEMDKRVDPEEVARTERIEKMDADIETFDATLKKLEDDTAKASVIREELKQVLEELKQLEAERDAQKKNKAKNRKTMIQIEASIEQLKKRIEELEAELMKIEEEIQRLKQELAKRTGPPPDPDVQVRPGGSGRNLDPTFVECRKTEIVIHDGPKPGRVRLADIAKSPVFLKLLKQVKSNRRGTVVFLMRSDAISTYHTASQVARQNYCRNGKLPVVGQGQLDLSIFKQ